MSMAGTIGGIAGALASGMAMRWLIKRTRREVPAEADGSRILRYSAGYGVIGFVGLAGGVAMGAGAIICVLGYIEPEWPGQLSLLAWACGVLGLAFVLMSVFLLKAWRHASLRWSTESAQYSPAWGRSFHFTWDDIREVRYSRASSWWLIVLQNGRKARIGILMHGAVQFMQEVSLRTRLCIPPPYHQTERKS
jgi:hypothetical protein